MPDQPTTGGWAAGRSFQRHRGGLGATSFAGAHDTVLGVSGVDAIVQAIRDVHQSGWEPGAQAYRARQGLEQTSRMAVIIQQLMDADVAGVLFTRNPASWGLGEAVVSGLVTPDRYRLDPTGRLLERSIGEKDLAIRRSRSGGTEETPVPPQRITAPCLTESNLAALHALADVCDHVYGSPDHDIEFAFRGDQVFLLQRRPITGKHAPGPR